MRNSNLTVASGDAFLILIAFWNSTAHSTAATALSNSAKNNRGHEIYTIQNDNGSPAISMINAYFDNPKKDNAA